MTIRLSVVTCAHNPRPHYLARVFDALRSQTLPLSEWEYVLVDNRSDAPLAEVCDLAWHPNSRTVREDELGLTHARLRGIRESVGELLVFVDDDNVLCPSYLASALRLSTEFPWVGTFGGSIEGEFEIPPPAWTKRYLGNLAIRTVDVDVWSNIPLQAETTPAGAGMCVRREVADRYAQLLDESDVVILDRQGSSLFSGGDSEIAATACDMKKAAGLFRVLKLIHLIPRERLSENYLISLLEAISYSSVLLRAKRGESVQKPAKSIKSGGARLIRLFLLNRRERQIARAVERGERNAYERLSLT